jgi:hypothetical protein
VFGAGHNLGNGGSPGKKPWTERFDAQKLGMVLSAAFMRFMPLHLAGRAATRHHSIGLDTKERMRASETVVAIRNTVEV